MIKRERARNGAPAFSFPLTDHYNSVTLIVGNASHTEPEAIMSSAYFAPLVIKPIIINTPGQYITRSGEVVTVTVASSKQDFGCLGHYADGVCEGWHRSGRIWATSETANDIISISEG